MPKMLLDIPEKTADYPDTPAALFSPETEFAGGAENSPPSALAMGLPGGWSIEPPAAPIRRKARVL
jgi:hypothetical protein